MTEDYNESTRVMPAGGEAPIDRTMVATAAPPVGATQMGTTVACAVCGTTNPGLETYCVECGFLLASTPGPLNGAAEPESEAVELVESNSGRRFRVREGVNTVGRENSDILLLDGTVSRRHAEVKLEDGAITVTDLGSTNGTQVDGNRLAPNQPTAVVPGTVIRFGNATLTLPGAADSGPAEATIVSGGFAVEQTLIAAPAPPQPMEEFAESTLDESGAVAKLTGSSGTILLKPGSLTVGRRPGSDVVLDDAYVSGRHAEFNCGDSGCTITDLGSTNGTTVNGQRLEANSPQALADGDEVQIGQTAYRFETIPGLPGLPDQTDQSDQSDLTDEEAAEPPVDEETRE